MTLHVFLLLLLFVLVFSLTRLCSFHWTHHYPARSATATKGTPIQRLRHRPAPQTIAPPVASPAPLRRL
jgi:hypothetical protein